MDFIQKARNCFLSARACLNAAHRAKKTKGVPQINKVYLALK